MYKCVFAIFPFLNLCPQVAQNVNIEELKNGDKIGCPLYVLGQPQVIIPRKI